MDVVTGREHAEILAEAAWRALETCITGFVI
jgi:hypothetical protein